MNGSELVAAILQRERVSAIIGFPHSELFDAAAALGIRPLITRTERVAVNMAEGFTRVTDGRSTGVVTVQYGPGAENAFGAIAQAYSDNAPLLFLPTGYPRGRETVAPNFQASRNFRHITRWSETAVTVDRLPQMLQHAFTRLRNGGPGPVLLELPTDVLAENSQVGPDACPSAHRSLPQADAGEIGRLLERLLQAKRPVIYAGQGVLSAQAWSELKELAEILHVPVLTTLNGKSAFPESHPLALGTGGKSRPATVDYFLGRADLVVGIGTSFTRSLYVTPVPAGKTMVQITIDERDIAKDYPITLGIRADAGAVLRQLLAELRGLPKHATRPAGEAVVPEIRGVREAFMAEWLPLLTSQDAPLSPYRVIWDLMHGVDRQRTVVTHDAGHPRDQMSPFYEAVVPHGYMGWGHTTQLGTGLGLMLGAKLARPDWLAANVMGEAAFGMVGMDFETAVRCDLPILTIVLRNEIMGGYGAYMPVATRKYRANQLTGEYAGVARALGAHGEQVAHPAELKPAISRCLRAISDGQAALLEVRTREEPRLPGV